MGGEREPGGRQTDICLASVKTHIKSPTGEPIVAGKVDRGYWLRSSALYGPWRTTCVSCFVFDSRAEESLALKRLRKLSNIY
jgi:hypothetical protein